MIGARLALGLPTPAPAAGVVVAAAARGYAERERGRNAAGCRDELRFQGTPPHEARIRAAILRAPGSGVQQPSRPLSGSLRHPAPRGAARQRSGRGRPPGRNGSARRTAPATTSTRMVTRTASKDLTPPAQPTIHTTSPAIRVRSRPIRGEG